MYNKRNRNNLFGTQTIWWRTSSDPEKVQAIRDIPEPQSKADLKRFLGMMAYLSKFIPHLSDETLILRQLISKNALWQFDQGNSKQFNHLKGIISDTILLKFFDPKLPTEVTCDLGATLKQRRLASDSIQIETNNTGWKELLPAGARNSSDCVWVFRVPRLPLRTTIHSWIRPQTIKNIFNNPMHKAPWDSNQLQKKQTRTRQFKLSTTHPRGVAINSKRSGRERKTILQHSWLNIVEGLILKGSRIVIPRSLIVDIKKPCIDADITNMIENCASCQSPK